jgi:hypothetical protein
MAVYTGRYAKVAFGTTAVGGQGKWSLDGITVDTLDTTAFGDTAKQFAMGLTDYGTLTFGGNYDYTDTGQNTLVSANINASKIANLRLYVDNTTYWVPDTTSVGAAGMYIQSVKITQDINGLGKIDVTAKLTGPLKLTSGT